MVVLESWNWMCGGRVDVWWFRFGCVVVFFVGWIWIYGTWVFGVDLWWLLEKIFDVWWFWKFLEYRNNVKQHHRSKYSEIAKYHSPARLVTLSICL